MIEADISGGGADAEWLDKVLAQKLEAMGEGSYAYSLRNIVGRLRTAPAVSGDSEQLRLMLDTLPADDIEGATLEWYAAKFGQQLGHIKFGDRLRSYAAIVRGWRPEMPAPQREAAERLEEVLVILDRLEWKIAAQQEAAEGMDNLLNSLGGWDMMDVASDGPYFKEAIRQTRAAWAAATGETK